MATYYVDPAASGANDGSSWTDAFTGLQSAVDVAGTTEAATIYCRGTQTLAASPISFTSSNQGSTTIGSHKIIGCNSSGTNDGTRFVINGDKDGSGTATAGITVDDSDYWCLENIEVKNVAGDGIETVTTTSYGWILNNVISHGNTGRGIDNGKSYTLTLFRCAFYSNGSDGIYSYYAFRVLFCSSHDNSGDGFEGSYASGTVIYGSAFYKNSGRGIHGLATATSAINTVIHDNGTDGIDIYTDRVLVAYSRITGAPTGEYGIDNSAEFTTLIGNYFDQDGGTDLTTSALINKIGINGTDTNTYNGSDTDYGYEGLASDNYTLSTTATKRDITVSLPTEP